MTVPTNLYLYSNWGLLHRYLYQNNLIFNLVTMHGRVKTALLHKDFVRNSQDKRLIPSCLIYQLADMVSHVLVVGFRQVSVFLVYSA